jgi:hypothetical protein
MGSYEPRALPWVGMSDAFGVIREEMERFSSQSSIPEPGTINTELEKHGM